MLWWRAVSLPVDLALPPSLLPERWAVVFGEYMEQEAYFRDRALAQAYASARRGQVVPLAALAPWPKRK